MLYYTGTGAYNPRVTTRPLQPHHESAERYWFVSAERYMEMLPRLHELAASLPMQPDVVIGIKRSGLFPAVYLSHVFKWPMLTDGEAKLFPYPKFQYPLIVDTTVWTGKSVRRAAARMARAEVPAANIQVLAAWVRDDPFPSVDQLHYLELTDRIMHFWYDEEETI